MAKKKKSFKPKARLPRGFRDLSPAQLAQQTQMLATIASIYEAHGFDALDTSIFEYADALGQFLPDDDRPNAGVFALEDDDGQWLSLRYDLTSPLARYVAEHYDHLPKPFRRYQYGAVFRNEKSGAGRWRQFMQMDADTVGAAGCHADAEMCAMAADAMEALGVKRGDYIIRINNRKILDGVLAGIGLDKAHDDYARKRLTILRAIDKRDRLGVDAVRLLLGKGRKDESGDFTSGAGLDEEAIAHILAFVEMEATSRATMLDRLADLSESNEQSQNGLDELRIMDEWLTTLGYGDERIMFAPSIVRGLDYYTGAVFEIELTPHVADESGTMQRIGAVGGGGRYDDLVKRFKGVEIPATGISIGISRLAVALEALEGLGALNKTDGQNAPMPPVIVLVMERARMGDYARMVQDLRASGIRAELYMGDGSLKAQLRYADQRGARLVVIEGEDERAKGVVTLKDLAQGLAKSTEIADNAAWRASGHAQQEVKKNELSAKIKAILAENS